MIRVPDQYPPDWVTLSRAVKEEAGWRCVRCHHPFLTNAYPKDCDGQCDPIRGIHRKPKVVNLGGEDVRLFGLNFGVHHLDGDTRNSAWWNLLPLCNSCHLTTQSKVIVERPWILAHSAWFIPYVCGFYAHYHGNQSITREEAMAEPALFLAMGQPQLYEQRA